MGKLFSFVHDMNQELLLVLCSVMLSCAQSGVLIVFFSFCIRYSLLFPTLVVIILKPKLLERVDE